jgi:hypothetical protein
MFPYPSLSSKDTKLAKREGSEQIIRPFRNQKRRKRSRQTKGPMLLLKGQQIEPNEDGEEVVM